MSIPLTLILSMSAALLGSIVKQCYVNQTPKRIASGFIFNTIVGVTAAVILVLWGGFGGSSVFTVLLGLLFGAVTALQGVSNVAALQCGPMSYTSVIISFSTLVSALSGVLFFDEGLGWAQIVGIALMLVSFVLAAKSDGEEKKANLKWLILCIVAFAATGAIGIMQKVHQSSAYKGELNAFLVIAFVSSSFFCGLAALVAKRQEGAKADADADTKKAHGKQFWLLLVIILLNGACVAVNNKFNLYLSGVMDSAVFFPLVNGGGLTLTTLAAVVLFRERLSAKKWIGVALGIASVVFLCNPFQ